MDKTDTRPVTRGFLTAVLDGIATRLGNEVLGPMRKQVAQMELRVKALETKPSLQYMGIWSQDESYREGDFVTDHGSLWHCNETGTRARPGQGLAWQLAAKRGRDANTP